MALPIAHAAAGYLVHRAERRLPGGARPAIGGWQRALAFAVIGNLPDLDFLGGFLVGRPGLLHRGSSHTVLAALIFGVAAGAFAQWRWRERFGPAALAFGAAYLSHLVLDYVTIDTRPPAGAQFLWPFSSAYFIAPVTIFTEIYIDGRTRVGFLRTVLAWPTVVVLAREIVIATVVVWVILTFVIPVFATLYEGLGVSLPLPTRITIWLSKFLGTFWWAIFGAIGVTSYSLYRYKKTYRGRRVIDAAMLKIPVIGGLLRKIAVARFCRTLSTLVSSGVPILEGLEITARTSGNSIVEDAIMATRKSVEEGKTISEPLKNTDVFPQMVAQMIAVGEHTGALDTMLAKIADFYEDEVDEATANLLAMLEPLIIAFLGVVIGGIVVSMYLPMFSLLSKIG